jgi:hypothetical protein
MGRRLIGDEGKSIDEMHVIDVEEKERGSDQDI